MERIVTLVNLRYPYGGKQIYLNHSLVSVAARLLLLDPCCRVRFVDLNVEEYQPRLFAGSEKIGISLLGAPYIPAAIDFVRKVQNDFPGKKIAVGGQVIEKISCQAFTEIFKGLETKQIIDDNDFAEWFGINAQDIPSPLEVSCVSAWKQLPLELLREYLQHEMTLDVSRGCAFNCSFCAARKDQRERLISLEILEKDLGFLARTAKFLGLKELKFYASSLDFFQNPTEKIKLLKILAKIRLEIGLDIKVRCLTCMSSFLSAGKVPNFSNLVKGAGIYCVGFGVDGTEEVWIRENKKHNKPGDIQRCIALCHQLGVKGELLMVLGFPDDSLKVLLETMWNCILYGFQPGVELRPYLAKDPVPGNEYWPRWEQIFVQDPQKFRLIDYFALQSRLIDESFWHRWACNLTYLFVVGLLRLVGRCSSIPLLPYRGAVAKIWNRLMPADR